MRNRIRFSKRGQKTFEKLDATDRQRCERALVRFQEDERNPGLNFELLRGAKGLRSIRIDRNWRIILARRTDDIGEVWEVDDVGPHDLYRTLGRK